jgi:hypothetical protein
MPGEFGIDALSYEELAALGPAAFSMRARERAGTGACFLSFDIDFVDPAFAPGTGTPEVGGPSSREALLFLRSLAGLDFRGFDCVEVAPAYDPSGVTAFVARTRASRFSLPAPAAEPRAVPTVKRCRGRGLTCRPAASRRGGHAPCLARVGAEAPPPAALERLGRHPVQVGHDTLPGRCLSRSRSFVSGTGAAG